MESNFIWTDGIEHALNDFKKKSFSNSEYHKKNYYYLKGYLKYFRVPTIILSGMNSVFSVGLQPYISQGIISILCCSISLICGIIASVELFLGLQTMMEKELISSKDFYILSSDIFKTLAVERPHRMLNGKIYLDNIHTKYCNLIEKGNLLESKLLLKTPETLFKITNIGKTAEDVYKAVETITKTADQLSKISDNIIKQGENVLQTNDGIDNSINNIIKSIQKTPSNIVSKIEENIVSNVTKKIDDIKLKYENVSTIIENESNYENYMSVDTENDDIEKASSTNMYEETVTEDSSNLPVYGNGNDINDMNNITPTEKKNETNA